MHRSGRPGKIEITPTKPLTTQRDLSLAYSPGRRRALPRDPATIPNKVYDYTAKGNLVAVISNGTAVLGLGNIGALAAKPVMEGKAVLFKRFADIDVFDLEVDTEDVDEFVDCVRLLEPTFGGINLEDIKAPDCFVIEQRLRELMDIPVFHDDQHGTAIIAAAGLLNALDLTGRSLPGRQAGDQRRRRRRDRLRRAAQGHGPAARERDPVRHQGRDLPGPRGRHEPVEVGATRSTTDARTLAEAMVGADVFFGLSAKGAVDPGRWSRAWPSSRSSSRWPTPIPEITPEAVKAVRPDAIIATGRSDYPNQVNNVLGFPYIFRGALDVRATTINEAMKIAAAYALAALAREDVPDEVSAAYRGRRLRFGPELHHPEAVRSAPDHCGAVGGRQGGDGAAASRASRSSICERYRDQLRARLDPTASRMQLIIDRVRAHPKRVVFAEGEEEKTIRAAIAWRNAGFGTPVLIGREERIHETMAGDRPEAAGRRSRSTTPGCQRAQRRLHRVPLPSARSAAACCSATASAWSTRTATCSAACMVAQGDADAMVTGLTRNYIRVLRDVHKVIDPKPGERLFGLTMMVARGRTVFIADTAVHELPTRGRARRHRDPGGAQRAPHGLHAARRVPVVLDLRQPAGRAGDARPGRGRRARPARGRLRVRRRDVGRRRARPRAAGALPVLPAVGAGQRPDHAGAAHRPHQLACCSSSWAAAR